MVNRSLLLAAIDNVDKQPLRFANKNKAKFFSIYFILRKMLQVKTQSVKYKMRKHEKNFLICTLLFDFKIIKQISASSDRHNAVTKKTAIVTNLN